MDETGVKIQVPRDNGVSAAPPSESNEPAYEDDEPEEALVTITLFGDGSSVAQAKQRILGIVNERTSRLSSKITTIPVELYHLLSAKVTRHELVSDSDAESTTIRIPPVWKYRSGAGRGAPTNAADNVDEQKEEKDNAILVSGEKEAVMRTVQALSTAADELKTIPKISMTIGKVQHRFFPPVIDQIMQATSCSVEVPRSSDPSDQITIRGPSSQLGDALQMVMQTANTPSVDTINLAEVHGISTPSTYAKQCARYLLNKAKLRKIADEENVQIFIPRPNESHTTVDIVATQGPRGPAATVAAARAKVLDVLRTLPPSLFDSVEVDQLLHRFLIGRKRARIQSFEEKNRVQVVFPPAPTGTAEDKSIILIYVGSEPAAAPNTFSDVKEEILKLAKEAADISSATLSIPAKLHKSIIGPGGTTLNALIGVGDERIVDIKFGSSPAASKGTVNGDAAENEDEIVIRGPTDEVQRLEKEIERIAEEAQNDEIVNSYVRVISFLPRTILVYRQTELSILLKQVVEFDIEQRFVSHIVGKGGSGVQKLRDDLGIRVDFGDAVAPAVPSTDMTSMKAKKASSGKAPTMSSVRIQGRKENAEEAKKRILRQTESLVRMLPELD